MRTTPRPGDHRGTAANGKVFCQMITDQKIAEVNEAMAAAREAFTTTLREADAELAAALSAHVAAGDATANWNLLEAHNKHRNIIEGASFKLRLAFLKIAGRRE